MSSSNFSNTIYCSFCKRSNVEVQKIIAGFENSSICNQCVNICQNLLREYGDKVESYSIDTKFLNKWRGITPKNIKKTFDDFIIGQEKTKKILSVAVYNHYKRVELNFTRSKHKSTALLEKSNILLIGPTGSGKTLFAKTLANYLDVPFSVVDATTLTQAGYVGEDVENILTRLLESAEGNIKKAELGIIYIDEIDKIAKKANGLNNTRDISGEGVQQSLLKIVEGSKCLIPKKLGKKHTEQDFIQFNTESILFICAGSFVGLNSILEDNLKVKKLGFDGKSVSKNKTLPDVQPEDLIKFGIIPEFIGRFPVVGSLSTLTEQELYKILTSVKNSVLNQYKSIFSVNNIKVAFTKKGLDIIIKSCNNINVGARGLKVFIEKILNVLVYNIDRLQNRILILDDKFILKTIK